MQCHCVCFHVLTIVLVHIHVYGCVYMWVYNAQTTRHNKSVSSWDIQALCISYARGMTCYWYMCVYIYIYIHTYIHTYIHMCLHIYIYTYIFTLTQWHVSTPTIYIYIYITVAYILCVTCVQQIHWSMFNVCTHTPCTHVSTYKRIQTRCGLDICYISLCERFNMCIYMCPVDTYIYIYQCTLHVTHIDLYMVSPYLRIPRVVKPQICMQNIV